MRVLVTGAAGFIGSHLVDRLLAEGFAVVGVDDLSTGRMENVVHNQGKRGFEFVRGDICDTALDERVVRDVEAVFHEAALVSVSRSVEDPILTNRINVDGTLALLRACLDSDVKRFIYASTCAVYGDAASLPAAESHLPDPISPYAVSKLAAEERCSTLRRGYPTTINELAGAVLDVVGKQGLRSLHSEPRPGDIRHSYGSREKAERQLSFRAKIGLKQGLRKTVEWIVKSSS